MSDAWRLPSPEESGHPGPWHKRWREIRQEMRGKEAEDAFECHIRVATGLQVTLMDVDAMPVFVFASHIHELRLTHLAPNRLRLPGIGDKPEAAPATPPRPALPVEELAVLESFVAGEGVGDGPERVLDGLVARGALDVEEDEFGPVYTITEAGRAIVAPLGGFTT